MRSAIAKTRQAITALAATVVLAACTSSPGWLDRGSPGGSPLSAGSSTIPGAPSADDYLRELDLLATGDPATQAEIFADAESAATLTPDPTTALRFGLVLATPGHSGTSLEHAQSLLREVLTQSALMTPSEVSLAHIYLNSVEQRLLLEAEARQLREYSASSADRTEEIALNQRLAAVEAENRRLRSDLAEAQDKLEAITSIETLIREEEQ